MSSQPQCPKCAAQLKDDYGMVECPSCGVFVFVDMDGIAQISEEINEFSDSNAPAPEVALDPPNSHEDAHESFEQSSEGSSHGFTFNSAPDLQKEHEEQASALVPLGSDPAYESNFDEQTPELVSSDYSVTAPIAPEGESTLSGSQQDHEIGGNLDMDALLGFNQPSSELPPEEFGAPGDPLGLNDYANSELSQAKDGLLSFKILISGIDSKEMRETLRSALDDQRFGWNPNELISRISKGVLRIDNVASVKAVILINRIKRMPVKVRWEQYAITKMEPT